MREDGSAERLEGKGRKGTPTEQQHIYGQQQNLWAGITAITNGTLLLITICSCLYQECSVCPQNMRAAHTSGHTHFSPSPITPLTASDAFQLATLIAAYAYFDAVRGPRGPGTASQRMAPWTDQGDQALGTAVL